MRAELVLLLCVCVGCQSQSPEAPAEPAYTCETACENLRQLDCPEAESTSEGGTCEDVCQNSFEVGISAFEWDVEQATVTEVCEDGG